jgi:hypothetical protein
MQTWQKASIVTLITLAIGGIYLFTVFEHRRNPGVVPNSAAAPATNMDDVAPVRLMYMTTFDDALNPTQIIGVPPVPRLGRPGIPGSANPAISAISANLAKLKT